jgi:rare lipoprotein A
MRNTFVLSKVIAVVFMLFSFLPKVFCQDSAIVIKDTTNFTKQNTEDTAAIEPQKTNKVLFGTASYYAQKFEGRKTANGEIFSHKKLTAACNVLPLGTWIKVTNLKNNKSVIVKTNDRLHPSMKRVVDLTMAAAKQLDFVNAGLTNVKVEVLKGKGKK